MINHQESKLLMQPRMQYSKRTNDYQTKVYIKN